MTMPCNKVVKAQGEPHLPRGGNEAIGLRALLGWPLHGKRSICGEQTYERSQGMSQTKLIEKEGSHKKWHLKLKFSLLTTVKNYKGFKCLVVFSCIKEYQLNNYLSKTSLRECQKRIL